MTGPVEDMVWCRWEAAHVEADHHCVGVGRPPTPCPDAVGNPCGRCERCLAAQTADLIRHGSPSDMDVPDVDHLREIRSKALSYLRDQRVMVMSASGSSFEDRRPREVTAAVRGHRDSYLVAGRTGVWRCACNDQLVSRPVDQCRHAAAVALVVGWPSAAAPLTTQAPPEESP